jgi:glycerophosphoryl diester phosphodiesterase
MKIVCHRGAWKKKSAQNTLSAIKEALAYDGVEIDLRNFNGKIVMSHDPLKGPAYDTLESAFKLKAPDGFFWALNIKEDGLASNLRKLLGKYRITNYMCFDLSFPEKVTYVESGLRVFERFGDLEPRLPPTREIVLDCFKENSLGRFLKAAGRKRTFVISPELHGRDHAKAWRSLKGTRGERWLCTDFPEEASEYFS